MEVWSCQLPSRWQPAQMTACRLRPKIPPLDPAERPLSQGNAVISALFQCAIAVPACARALPPPWTRASAGSTRNLPTQAAPERGGGAWAWAAAAAPLRRRAHTLSCVPFIWASPHPAGWQSPNACTAWRPEFSLKTGGPSNSASSCAPPPVHQTCVDRAGQRAAPPGLHASSLHSSSHRHP
jgi:hypothetical protein